jgi:hypothetical protein
MNAISNVSLRAFPDTRNDIHPLQTIALFCGFALVILVCAATYGLDLSAGFF